jgi:CelD/BcsL family acetyltransferase involved in cellulose biosynthesis
VKLRRLVCEDQRWIAFLSAREDASPFHHPAWLAVLRESYGFPTSVIAFTSEDERVMGGLPVAEVSKPFGARRWVSLPFTDYCPPLLAPGVELRAVLSELEALRQTEGMRSLELRGGQAHPGQTDGLIPAGVRHVLALDNEPSKMFASFKSSTRRNVRAALAKGVRVERRDGKADLTETFYRLQSLTRRRLGVPVQPRRYFESLWRNLIATKLGFLLLAFVEERPVAGAIFLEWNGVTVYKHGASDHAYWPLRPNDLLFSRAIDASAARGVRFFDFGRSAWEDEGLRRFKRGWGASEYELVYTMLAPEPARSGAPRASRLLAPVIRRGPIWLTRWLGRAFYRYAA